MSNIVVIPARYESSRFPGKPLARIAGRSMIERTWSLARMSRGVDQVLVATDDDRIEAHCRSFGADVVRTSPACRNGTERVLEAVKTLPTAPAVVVNLQGDSPLTPPWVIEALVSAMAAHTEWQFGTVAVPLAIAKLKALQDQKAHDGTRGTLVVVDQAGRALYFSRSVIPYVRTQSTDGSSPVRKHVGMYAYRPQFLELYAGLPPTPLEVCEGLEQLRALEHGYPLHVVDVDYRGRTSWSVDSPLDVSVVEEILAKEGEF